MAIELDHTSQATPGSKVTGLTWQHTCGTGTTILVVMVQVVDSTLSDRTVSSVTYNGDALTRAACDADEDSYLRTEIWYRINPDIGSNQDIVVTMGGQCTDLMASAISLIGVDTDSPINDADAAVGNSADAQVTISPTVDYAWLIASLGDDYSVASGTLIGLNNEIHQTDIGQDVLAAGYKSNTGAAGNYDVGWHFYSAYPFVISAIALKPAGGTVKAATATMSGTGTLAAKGGATRLAAATLAGAGTLAAKGSYLRYGAATLAGTGSLAAQGAVYKTASATVLGAGSLAAVGRRTRSAAATLSGSGFLAATAHKTATAKATPSGEGSIAAAAHRTRSASATLSGAGDLAAIGTKVGGGEVRTASATMAGTGSLAAAARRIRSAAATLSGEGTLSAGAVLIAVGSATMAGTGTLAARGVLIIVATATMSGAGTLAAAGTVYTGISDTLLAAQQSPRRIPYVEAKVYDYERGIKRLAWTRLYIGNEPDNHHGIAFDGEGSMHRIRAAPDNKLYHQKITSPGHSSDYSQWTEIAADCSGPCAIAASGAKVYIFYRKTDNTLRKYYSHNYGSSWTNAELSTYADVLSLAAAWWGTSDSVVCFALKSNQLNAITLNSITQETQQHPWSDGNHPWLNTYGLGATYNAALDQCELVIAAKESDSPYSHYDLFRTTFSNIYNFLALESFLMAPDGEDITYEYPDCHLPAEVLTQEGQPYETNRVLAVEKFAGTTAYTRPIISHSVKGTSWSDNTFTEARPFMDIAPSYGLRLITDSSYWWISMPAGVWRAPRPASPAIVLTSAGDIVSLTQNKPGTLVLTLDNSQSQYSPPNLLNKLNKRTELVLKLGYKTTAGAEAMAAGTYWIDSWEYSQAPNQSAFTITALDGWGLLERWAARHQMRWNKDEADPRSVWQIMYQVLARVGIRLTNTPPKPRSSAIDNFYPDFTIDPGTQGTQALNKLLSFVPDGLVFRGQEAFTKNPLASESSSYTYGTAHAILAGRYAENVTPSRSRALGAETDGDRIVEDALDWDALDLAIDILDQDYDPNLQNAARTQERADAILRKASLRAQGGQLTVPTNVAQELLDVITATDPRCGIDEQKYRVLAMRTAYDHRNARYDQTLTLGAP